MPRKPRLLGQNISDWLEKGGTWYVQEEKDLIKVEYANMRKDKAVETALSVDQKEDYFFFVLVVGCSVLSAPGSSFSKAG